MSDSIDSNVDLLARHVLKLTEGIRLGDMKSSSNRTNCNFSRTRKPQIWCLILHFFNLQLEKAGIPHILVIPAKTSMTLATQEVTENTGLTLRKMEIL